MYVFFEGQKYTILLRRQNGMASAYKIKNFVCCNTTTGNYLITQLITNQSMYRLNELMYNTYNRCKTQLKLIFSDLHLDTIIFCLQINIKVP